MSSLENRDYTIVIDKSGSMTTKDCPGNKSRWFAMQESVMAIAGKCEEIDPDGITIYTFASSFRRYDNCTSTKVLDIFKENEPNGGTNLALVLKDVSDNYFARKAAGKAQLNGEIVLVVTDGEPSDKQDVVKTIMDIASQLDHAQEFGISFIQIGSDLSATKYLKILDDDLEKAGSKYDIVDTITAEAMENSTITEVLMGAIFD